MKDGAPSFAYTFRHRAIERAEGIEPPSQPGKAALCH
jgi:hypothetical protein